MLGMNMDELKSNAGQLATALCFFLVGAGVISQAQSSEIVQEITALVGAIGIAIPAILGIINVLGSAYRHFNMKKVPENSTAINTSAAMPVGATVPASVAAIAKVVGVFLIGMLLLSMYSAPAMAQLKPLTGNIARDFSPPTVAPLSIGGQTKDQMVALWQALQKASAADLVYAIAMATAANKASSPSGITTAAGMRLSCLTAIQTLNGQIGGANLVDATGKPLATRPDPALFTDAETLAEVIDAVQPGGPLWTSCSGAAQLAATNTVAFVNALVTGAAGLALVAPIK